MQNITHEVFSKKILFEVRMLLHCIYLFVRILEHKNHAYIPTVAV